MLGVVSIIALLSISEGAKSKSLKSLEALGTRKLFLEKEKENVSWTLYDMRAFNALAEVIPVKSGYEILFGGAKPMRIETLATNEQFAFSMREKVAKGRFLTPMDLAMRSEVCVVGSELVRQIGPRASIGSALRVGDRMLTVVGILADPRLKEGGSAITKHDLSRSLLYPFSLDPEGALTELILEAKNPQDDEELLRFTRQFLKRRSLEEAIALIVPSELILQVKETERLFHLVLISIGVISLAVGGLGIATVMLASVYERTREIGIRRAVGATKRAIMQQFLLEALAITTIGSLLGLIVGTATALSIASFATWESALSFKTPLLALALAFTTGLLAGFYPAYRAASLDPIVALRQL